jgi:hypothetical protein
MVAVAAIGILQVAVDVLPHLCDPSAHRLRVPLTDP